MKKLFALLLSVMMAASLAVPAFADGPDGPPTPEDLGIIGGADGPTAIITSDFDLESFKWDGYDLEGLDTDATDWAELEKQLKELQQLIIDQEKEALGGVPGQIGVMVNGAYVKFPDAAPEIANGRTMIPVRALMETLGGEAEFVDGKVICKTDEIRLTFTPGVCEVLVEYPGGELLSDGQMFPLDCAPYIKGGRTYVPVRFIGEALGYEVGWDSEYQTAVLLDRKGVAEDWDQVFTILNRALGSQASAVKEGENYQAKIKGNATITAFDTLNGNQTYTVDWNGKSVFNTEAVNGTCSVILSDNAVDALVELEKRATIELDMDYGALARTVLTGLKDMEVIMSRDGAVYVRIPVLETLSGEKNLWYHDNLDMEQMLTAFAGTGTATMGGVLASALDVSSVESWAELSPLVQDCAGFLGDAAWTTDGGVSTLVIDAGTIDPEGERGIKDAFKEYRITMKVDEKGGMTAACVMETAAKFSVPGMKLSIDSTASGGQTSLTMTIHVANLGEMTLTQTSTRQATSEQPVTEPAGGNIAPFDWPQMF